MKFSNDGKLMLLTTANGHVHVLDAFRGTLVSHCYFRKLLHRCFGSMVLILFDSLFTFTSAINIQCEACFKWWNFGGLFQPRGNVCNFRFVRCDHWQYLLDIFFLYCWIWYPAVRPSYSCYVIINSYFYLFSPFFSLAFFTWFCLPVFHVH